MKNKEYLDWVENELSILGRKEATDRSIVGISSISHILMNSIFDIKTICENTGVAFTHVRDIMTDLMYQFPLTPIEENEINIPIENAKDTMSGIDVKNYRCSRWEPLTKQVIIKNGEEIARYHDKTRSVIIDINDPNRQFHGGIGEAILYEMDPIKFPYEVSKDPIRIYMESFRYKNKDTEDTFAVMYFRYPGGKMVEVKRFFKLGKNGLEEIHRQDYFLRKKRWEDSNKDGKSE